MVASLDQPVPVVPSQVPIPGAGRPLGSAIQRTKSELFYVVRTGKTPYDATQVGPGHFRGCWRGISVASLALRLRFCPELVATKPTTTAAIPVDAASFFSLRRALARLQNVLMRFFLWPANGCSQHLGFFWGGQRPN
jgi:hypothetical protein